jgi:tRNA nucleotidyltransferase (CCA-adding enzyme)
MRRLTELEQRISAVVTTNQALTIKDLQVTGKNLIEQLGITSGPVIGELLRKLLEEVLEAPEHNERERLLERARELLKSSEKLDAG